MASSRIPLNTIQKTAEKRVVYWCQRLKNQKRRFSLTAEIWVVSGPRMVAINWKSRKKRKVTDVLSFPAADFFQKQGILGELVICGPVLIRQAGEVGHHWKSELDVLIVHGLLHLLGWDHEASVKEARSMARLENRLLESVGLVQRVSF